MHNSIAPVIIFTYKRLDTLKKTIDSLMNCKLANETDVFIFSDAAKGPNDEKEVNEVRTYLSGLTGFKGIHIEYAAKNKGLANSIIQGVSKIIDQYEQTIVLEDDLIVSENFLQFMNASLAFYKNNTKVFSISGYSLPVRVPNYYKYDVYFTPRGLSWGWATWKDRWNKVDWQVSDFEQLKNNSLAKKSFAQGGTDLFPMLEKQMTGNLDSWAIRWFYSQFKMNQLTVYPVDSTVMNMGFDERATHTNVYNRYETSLDRSGKKSFIFTDKVEVDPIILKSFQRYYSISTRIFYGRIITPLYRLKQRLWK